MRRAVVVLISTAAAGVALLSHGQTTQGQAFNDGKAYKSQTPAIKNGINNAALDNVPGQDATTTNNLQGLYGATLNGPGQEKIASCAAYVPGSDVFKNAECDTVNYVSGNPSTRPTYTIDKVNDPVIVRSSNVRNTAEVNTGDMPGLSGSYTACTNQTTNQPERYDTERCQIGRPVTESQCNATLNVTYSWQSFAGQSGADLRYARCNSDQLRGDQLAIPLNNGYRTEAGLCADNGHGAGVEYRIWYRDCSGMEVQHGYDASACSAPPTPAVVDPPRNTIQACADAPRTVENCFVPDGHFTQKAQVPVFVDHWDNSACADLNSNGAVIVN